MQRFYLGTHEPYWLARSRYPLFVSLRRLRRKPTVPRARTPWAMDSGGFTELDRPPHHWTLTARDFAELVAEYSDRIGSPEWAAPQDWMCEPPIIEKTGLSVREHQERTVANYLELRGHGPFIPVLQGWTFADYEHCLDLYGQAGVTLADQPLVGLGTVCRRQATGEIASLVTGLHEHGLRLHGFGVKRTGLACYGHLLASADSTAWSLRARLRGAPLPGHTHKSCANCLEFAERWADGETL